MPDTLPQPKGFSSRNKTRLRLAPDLRQSEKTSSRPDEATVERATTLFHTHNLHAPSMCSACVRRLASLDLFNKMRSNSTSNLKRPTSGVVSRSVNQASKRHTKKFTRKRVEDDLSVSLQQLEDAACSLCQALCHVVRTKTKPEYTFRSTLSYERIAARARYEEERNPTRLIIQVHCETLTDEGVFKHSPPWVQNITA